MSQNEENTVYLPNILSVFDGMSCGQVSLDRAGIAYENYFASEIDKYAIQVANKNYPKTIQLGTIENWREWDLPKIDILIGGSPCQGFSNAGLGLNFDDPRSKLFFTYVDILNDLREKNPDLIFLLENVRMKKEWRDIITKLMGVEPIEINSALVSAQNRKRLYWTNIEGVEQPEDRGIVLSDILEGGDVDRDKSYAIDANYYKGGNPRSYFEDGKRQLVFEHQSHRRAMVKVKGAALRNQVTKRGVEAQLNVRKDEKSNCVVPSYPHKLNGMVFVEHTNLSGNKTRHYDKTCALRSNASANYQMVNSYRKLYVVECERLQTLPDNYTEGVSNTQRYKMIGNGWTIEVIAHIFRNIQVAEPLD